MDAYRNPPVQELCVYVFPDAGLQGENSAVVSLPGPVLLMPREWSATQGTGHPCFLSSWGLLEPPCWGQGVCLLMDLYCLPHRENEAKQRNLDHDYSDGCSDPLCNGYIAGDAL